LPESIISRDIISRKFRGGGGASHLRRDYHFTEYPEEAGHQQTERHLNFF
jgi:hypothetical protein